MHIEKNQDNLQEQVVGKLWSYLFKEGRFWFRIYFGQDVYTSTSNRSIIINKLHVSTTKMTRNGDYRSKRHIYFKKDKIFKKILCTNLNWLSQPHQIITHSLLMLLIACLQRTFRSICYSR